MKISVNELRSLLREGVVLFEYPKKDGSTRLALGTLFPNLIPEDMLPKSDPSVGEGELKETKNLRYFDKDRNGWRSVSGDLEEVQLRIFMDASEYFDIDNAQGG